MQTIADEALTRDSVDASLVEVLGCGHRLLLILGVVLVVGLSYVFNDLLNFSSGLLVEDSLPVSPIHS